MVDRKIIWESSHLEYNPVTSKLYKPEDEEEYSEEDYGRHEHYDRKIKNLTATPWGLWDVDDTLHPMRQFKMWVGHTNFNIGGKSANLIEKTKGVEVLSILTRYRFIIGIGQMFDITDVKQEIEMRLDIQKKNKDVRNKEVSKKIDDIKKKIDGKYDKWAIFVFPNGNIEYIVMQKSQFRQFDSQLDLYKQAEEKTGGVLIEST